MAVALAIGAITLTPRPGDVTATSLCLICGRRGAADAVLNLLMFVPVGWLAARARASGRGPAGAASAALAAVAVGALASLAVELAQIPIPGRDASLGDLAFDTLGAGLGGVAWHLMAHRRARARSAPLAAALAGVLALWLGAGLLAPHPTVAPWWGQWTPDLGHLETYRGAVVSARIGGVAVPAGRLRSDAAVRAAVGRAAPLDLVLAVGPPTPGLAPVFSIYDADRREILLLGADGPDAVVRFRTLGAALRFDDAPLRFPRAFATPEPGDTVPVRLTSLSPRGWGRGACLRIGVGRPTCARWSPASSWDLLLPIGGAAGRALELTWLAALFLPAGLLTLRSTRRATLATGVAALVGVALVPWLAPVGRAPAVELLAAGAAVWLPRLLLGRGALPGPGSAG